MSTRKSIFALAALATLSLAALAPTSASAFGFGGHFGGGHFGGFGRHFGGEHFGGYRFGWGFERRFWYPRFSWRFEHRWYPRFSWGYGHGNWGSSYGSSIHICPLVSGVYCPPLPRPFKPVIHMGMAAAPAAE